MSTKFFTNQDNNSLLRKFEGVFTYIESIRYFDAVVGYFRASGYFKLRPFLDKVPKIRILAGINVDKLTKNYHDRGMLYLQNPETTKDTFIEEITNDIREAAYDETTERGIIQFINDLVDGKIEMRAHPSKTIHAKVYIFRPEIFNQYAPCGVITGSSNLTNAGLGANPESNYEFNVELRDFEEVKFATDEFERLWDESEPILKAEAERIRNHTYLKDNFTPFELYIKMLMEYFGKRVDYDPYNIDLLLPTKYMRLKYQSDAANQGYAVMMKHNGFILADVVGLGKTIVACMVIKKFIYENGTHTRVLVVTPPAIEDNWRRTIKDFELDKHFTFITIGSLHKILDKENYDYLNAGDFDMVVVDESHKFRNADTEMYRGLQDICKTPRSKPAENGDIRKRVILISATPLNNRPKDIENQLYLFQDRRNSTLEGVRNLQDYFKSINERYKRLAHETVLNIPKLKELFRELRQDVIEPLIIRRTRADVEKEYGEELHVQGITFPKVDDPVSLYYQLDERLSHLFYETVSLITSLDEDGNPSDGLGYYRYRAIEFLTKDEDRKMYGNVESISERLSTIMKILLVKRLESSFYAFTQSLMRFRKAIDNMLQMFAKDRIFIAPDLDINKLLDDGLSYDEIEAKLESKGGNNRMFTSDAFDERFIALLRSDKAKVDNLAKLWENVKTDPKLMEFTEQIQQEFFRDKRNVSGKLVIFTESKETADELCQHMASITPKKILCISSENRKDKEPLIRENFDANLEEERQKDDYQIIITTEVLAEGINLHRSNVVVNYDVPWNATRLMQRIGRVNRIGSKADRIFVYNYYPSAHGDAQIRLVNNALRKLQAFHTAFGEDNKVFSTLEEISEGSLFSPQAQQEENETLEYLRELKNFKKNHPKRFAEIAKIPDKARCGRTAADKVSLFDSEKGEYDYPLNNTTLAYLKSDNHPGVFCLVTPEMRAIELNFVKAAKIFKASETEKAVALHSLHHRQTLAGMEFFKSEKNQANVQSATKKNLSIAENKAITNINGILKLAPTEQKKKVLQQVLALIRKGTYGSKGLPKSVNDFFNANPLTVSNAVQFIDKLFVEVLDRYDLSAATETPEQPNAEFIINPQIVLTQSYQ